MSKKPEDLTVKQWLFVKEYLIDKNATQAAIRAGYSEKTAHVIGKQSLNKVKIKKHIDKELAKVTSTLEVTAERVIAEIAKMAFSNHEDITTIDEDGTPRVDLSRLTREQFAAVQEVQTTTRTVGHKSGKKAKVTNVKVKLADKAKALEQLGRYLKLFTDKVEHSGKIEVEGLTDEQLEARLAALIGEK